MWYNRLAVTRVALENITLHTQPCQLTPMTQEQLLPLPHLCAAAKMFARRFQSGYVTHCGL